MALKSKGQRRGYSSAIIQGALAGAAASMMKKSYKKKTNARSSKKTSTRRRTKVKSSSSYVVTMNKRKKAFKENHSNENKERNLVVPARRSSPMQFINAIMEPQWYRVSGLSQFDTSSGFITLSFRQNAAGNVMLPVHIWDITSLPNQADGVLTYPDAGYGLSVSNNTSTADATTYVLNSQDNAGVTRSNNSAWVMENVSDTSRFGYACRKAYHHWTHFKLNLYGTRARATKFKVDLIMLNEEFADFIQGGTTNYDKRKLYDYLARPYIYNNLNSGDPQTRDDIKLLKTYETTVAPITTDEYNAGSSVPHMQTLSWFINHNRLRRYDWRRDLGPGLDQNAAFDQEVSSGTDTRVDPKKRLYVVIRALQPQKRVAEFNVSTDPVYEPSYDYVLRNKFSLPL